MSKVSLRHQSGYTLVELMIATVVSGIILIGIMTFLVNSLVNNSVRSARADLLREAQLSLDVMVKDIRLSANVDEVNRWEDPNSPNADSTSGLGWSSDADTLVLATAAEDAARNILFQDATHYITEKNNIIYYVDNGTLYKRTLAAPVTGNAAVTTCPPSLADSDCPADRLSVANVSSLTFRYFDSSDTEVTPANARSVEATLGLRAVKFGREVDVTYSTRTVFRNE